MEREEGEGLFDNLYSGLRGEYEVGGDGQPEDWPTPSPDSTPHCYQPVKKETGICMYTSTPINLRNA